MGKQLTISKEKQGLLTSSAPYLVTALFFLVTCLSVNNTVKVTTAVCIVLALAAVVFRFFKLRDQVLLPLAMLAALVLMDGISVFYAVSGKFALYEFLKVLTAFCLALILLALLGGEGVAPGRRVASVLERSAALAGLVSIDMLSTHIISAPILFILGMFTPDYEMLSGVEAGIRMTSIFENPNVFAGCAGIGVLLSLGLALSSETGKERMGHVVCLFINALSFVLAFSMGATTFIAAAFLVYLVLEIKERRAGLFLLMVETLVVTMIGAALISMTSFQKWNGFQPVPLLCVIAGAAVLCLLDKYVGRRTAEKLAKHDRALLVIIAAVLAASVAFVLAAYNLTGGVTLQAGEGLRRSAYPEPGTYTLTAQADGPVTVMVESQNRQDTMMHTSTVLYQGDLSGAAFTVPEDSLVVYFNFSAGQAVHLESAGYEGNGGSGAVPLGYKLLPGFIANRIQGLFANQNAIQRLVFFEDGMKLFRRSPAVGLGLGSFENAIRSVQSFYYETRYAHNHYIQTLAETGLVGLVLFVGLLLVCAAAVLLERRKKDAHPLTPALGAALVFMAGHAATEVTFSYYCYLPMAFGVFALINLCCGKALPAPWLNRNVKLCSLVVCSTLMAAFLVLLCGNITAARKVASVPTFDSLEQAVQLDKFEWADYMVSYIASIPYAEGDENILIQADEYAARLTKVNSNTVPIYLAEYYLRNGHEASGLAMAEKYVNYVSSDQGAWQRTFDLLATYNTGTDTYRAGVARILQLMKDWNAANMGNITLSEANQAFLAELGL